MAILNKVQGIFIINGELLTVSSNSMISYRHDAIVEEFNTYEEALQEHKNRFPEAYLEG